jgi:hypothetical protein
MNRGSLLGLIAVTLGLFTALPASAGVPECGNIRLKEVSSCTIVGSLECEASCSELGIYKTACATKLVEVCGETCTLSANPTCTDGCTTQCTTDCDNGVNVICSHNCFAECTTTRDTECGGDADPEQCAAIWDANCDAECDAQCVTVDGGCYQHCVECCGGSCTADANMDCQTGCQEVEFEECEQEFRASCEGSCSGDGALFCDGEYIVSGSQLDACVKALAAQGIEAKAEGSISIGPDGVDGGLTGGFCAVSPASRASLAAPIAALAAAAAWIARRRRRSSRTSG